MLLGALSQYAGDIISNIINGRTGTSVFKPVSSVSTYVSAALSALVGGNKLLNSLGRAAISTAANYIENRIKGKKQSLKVVIQNLIKSTITDYICSTISKVAVQKIKSLSPKNYSSFAHSKYLKNKKMTPNQIKNQMQKLVRANVFAAKAFEFIAGSVANAV